MPSSFLLFLRIFIYYYKRYRIKLLYFFKLSKVTKIYESTMTETLQEYHGSCHCGLYKVSVLSSPFSKAT